METKSQGWRKKHRKAVGQTIPRIHKGPRTVCVPTRQKKDLRMHESLDGVLRKVSALVVEKNSC